MSKVWQLPEDVLIERLKANDGEVLHYLYKSGYPSVAHLIRSNSGDEQDAKDIYQEAFIILIENLQKPGFELNCRIQTYIYSISRRIWLKQLGARSKFSVLDNTENIVNTEEYDIDEDQRQMDSMQLALEKLGEPCKSLLEGFYFGNLSMQEISTRFGYTNADNAKNQKYKCLTRLKKIFFEKYQETV